MKTSGEWAWELDKLQQDIGVQQEHELAAFIQRVQDDAWLSGMLEAHSIVMDDSVIYPGMKIEDRIKKYQEKS